MARAISGSLTVSQSSTNRQHGSNVIAFASTPPALHGQPPWFQQPEVKRQGSVPDSADRQSNLQ